MAAHGAPDAGEEGAAHEGDKSNAAAASGVTGFKGTLRHEASLLVQTLRHRELGPTAGLVAGYSLLWLASLPLDWRRWLIYELPQEPAFTLSHLLVLAAASLMVTGSTYQLKRAWRKTPSQDSQGRQDRPWPLRLLAGATGCWLGLGISIYMLVMLNGSLAPPGWLRGDKLGRAAYLSLPLLYHGGTLSLLKDLPERAGLGLRAANLAVWMVSLVALARYPYALIDGEFYGPKPSWEPLLLGLLMAVAVVIGYWYGLRERLNSQG